jgi:hypothetical protein
MDGDRFEHNCNYEALRHLTGTCPLNAKLHRACCTILSTFSLKRNHMMENLCANFHSFYNSIYTLLPVGIINFVLITGSWLNHTLYTDAVATAEVI